MQYLSVLVICKACNHVALKSTWNGVHNSVYTVQLQSDAFLSETGYSTERNVGRDLILYSWLDCEVGVAFSASEDNDSCIGLWIIVTIAQSKFEHLHYMDIEMDSLYKNLWVHLNKLSNIYIWDTLRVSCLKAQ